MKRVVQSSDLGAYTLTKPLQATLKRWEDLRAYKAIAGGAPLEVVRLFRHDWNLIDTAVRAQSEKAYNASTVFYHGLPLIPHDEAAKPFALAAT